MSTPRRYHRLSPAERRDQILDAANELFAERGYDEVTIEDVAKSAGVARGPKADPYSDAVRTLSKRPLRAGIASGV